MEHADTLLKWSKKMLGSTIVNGIVRHTFFHQFCAGKPHAQALCILLCTCLRIMSPAPAVSLSLALKHVLLNGLSVVLYWPEKP